jgi:hypothetical protein
MVVAIVVVVVVAGVGAGMDGCLYLPVDVVEAVEVEELKLERLREADQGWFEIRVFRCQQRLRAPVRLTARTHAHSTSTPRLPTYPRTTRHSHSHRCSCSHVAITMAEEPQTQTPDLEFEHGGGIAYDDFLLRSHCLCRGVPSHHLLRET